MATEGGAPGVAVEVVGKKQEIVFHLELVGAKGLPKPEQTAVEFFGLGISSPVVSLPQEEESVEPGGWLFNDLEAQKLVEERRKQEEEAAQAAKNAKGKKNAAPPPAPVGGGESLEMPPPEALCRVSQPCDTPEARQRLLDAVCTPLRVTLLRGGQDAKVPLAVATLEVQELIHDTASMECSADLVWSPEFLAELKQEFDEQQAAAAAARATPASAEGGEAEGDVPEAPVEELALFVPPRSGQLTVRVSTADPIGRVLCPEDLNDWVVLTVRLDGVYALPEKLREVGPGVGGEPPLLYSLRALGLQFDGGTLFVPEVPPAEEVEEGGEPGAEGDQTQSRVSSPEFSCDIGQEEFVEGLMRAGFVGAHDDGPAIFEYLARPRTGLDGKIGKAEFVRIEAYAVPAAPSKVAEFRTFLVEQKGDLKAGFEALDEGSDNFLTRETFHEGLERLGLSDAAKDAEALFTALDTQDCEEITCLDVEVAEIYYNVEVLSRAETMASWLLACCGSVSSLQQQLDDTKSGTISSEQWTAALTRLGHPRAEEDGSDLFRLLDASTEGTIATASVALLEEVSLVKVCKALLNVEEWLVGTEQLDAHAAFSKLRGGITSDSLSLSEFQAACSKLPADFGAHPQVLFFALRGGCAGCIGPEELSRLFSYNTSQRKRRISACKTFIANAFDSAAGAFKALFDDHSEAYHDLEELQPRIEWREPQTVLRGYRGRAWLQQLLNTLRDERGRVDASQAGGEPGAWLYMFPRMSDERNQEQVADFKELTDPTQLALGRTARWHHAQAFLDLRRLSASESTGASFDFRAFLQQVEAMPTGINEAEELPSPAFGACQTYVKGTISLDRPLARLCPRNIQALPSLGHAQGLIPPPPEKKPPPTVVADLEYEARRIVGKLTVEFARMCKEYGYEEPKLVGPGGMVGPDVQLGRHGVWAHKFLSWLQDQDEGALFKELSADLRPAVVRWVRVEARDGPACGLNGNTQDAMYSGIRDSILGHLFRALNHDVDAQRRKRDAKLWRGPALHGEVDSIDPAFGKPADLAAKDLQDEKATKRLAFEYELLGELEHATALHEQLLALPHNEEQAAAWCGYARFLLRCGQRQPEALEALRHALSLQPPEAGSSFEEAALLACMLQNHALPLSRDEAAEPTPTARYEAARTVLEAFVDRHPTQQLPLLMLFVVHAWEAHGLQAELSENDGSGAADQAVAARIHLLRAEASKYLELARRTPAIGQGHLSGLQFAELEALTRQEAIARGERVDVPATAPSVPAAWQPPHNPVFPSYEAAHRAADAEDSPALQVIDLMLHFGIPHFVSFLIQEASEAYGFLSPNTVESEKCRLQLVKAAMLQGDWDLAITHLGELIGTGGDRLQKVYVLLGECYFRRAQQSDLPAASAYDDALRAFETALAFLPAEGQQAEARDPILHLRVATIHYLRAEASAFAGEEAMAQAVTHYKKSLQLLRTAEAWRNAGVCAYRQACLLSRRVDDAEAARPRQKLLRDALHFFKEANRLDNSRPQVNAWLVLCSVELGLVQLAKQTLRQVLRHQARLDYATAAELAQVLLRFSDERQAELGERGAFVQDGRYAQEAVVVAQYAQSLEDTAEVRSILSKAVGFRGTQQVH